MWNPSEIYMYRTIMTKISQISITFLPKIAEVFDFLI